MPRKGKGGLISPVKPFPTTATHGKDFAVQKICVNYLVATATAATAVVTAAEQTVQRAVLPHTVQKSNEYGSAAAGKNAFKSVAAATGRDK